MSKKRSRRSRSRGQYASAGQAAIASTTEGSETVDFREEYRYVVHDLKRFGVLALAMFATLIVLALVLA